jgi:hypothetical protein
LFLIVDRSTKNTATWDNAGDRAAERGQIPQVIGRRAEYLPVPTDGQSWSERERDLGIRDISTPCTQAV